ncbi:hypothetical protein Hypma_012192 [Hypsizygus marmoreus]|uniref:Uncharacterized protein n=1 Tax=Hypsizygus marmoreus TaxID=39966 RepID=A0A369JGZ4_HYPMA|nr:hypothetical protein Hypma_012192 [Hypsizygus marmoreus]
MKSTAPFLLVIRTLSKHLYSNGMLDRITHVCVSSPLFDPTDLRHRSFLVIGTADSGTLLNDGSHKLE